MDLAAERLQATDLTPPFAYQTVDHNVVADLACDDQLRESIMVVFDPVKQCDIISSVAAGETVKVCIDVDASLRIEPRHLEVRPAVVKLSALGAPRSTRQSDHGCSQSC